MATVQITRNGETLSEVKVSDSDWRLINYVDYIEVDDFDRVTAEFVRVHGLNAACRMQKIVGSALNVVIDDSGHITLPYALLGIAGYMVYWMVAHGIFHALTALQAGR